MITWAVMTNKSTQSGGRRLGIAGKDFWFHPLSKVPTYLVGSYPKSLDRIRSPVVDLLGTDEGSLVG